MTVSDLMTTNLITIKASEPLKEARADMEIGVIHHLPVVDDRGMASISVQHLVSLMLVDGTVTFESAHDDSRVADPRIARLTKLVRLDPAHPATITLTLDDGSQVSEQIGFLLGTPGNPMSRDQVVAKCHPLMAPVLGEARSRALIAALLDLENRRDMRTLRPLLQRSSPAPAPG